MSAKKKETPATATKPATENAKTKQPSVEIVIAKEDMFPEELNKHLLYQITSLTSENGDLRNFIKQRDEKIIELTKTISGLQDNIKDVISTGGPSVSAKSAGVISSKITELCKNNRHLVAELESTKTKCAMLERKIIECESKTSESSVITRNVLEEDKIVVIPSYDELKDLKDKLANATKKLFDSRNKQEQMKAELLLANKCLQNEIGPGFTSIQKLAVEPIGFKGRAEDIIIMKNKILELEEKLYGKNKNILAEIKKENTIQVIRDIEARRRLQVEKTAKDLEALQIEYGEVKKKMEGGIARIRNLTCEGVSLRQTIQNLTDKSAHDDKIKEELILQQKAVEKQYQELLKEVTMANESLRSSQFNIAEDLKNEKFRVSALTDKLEDRNKKIDHLNSQLTNVIENSLQKVYFTPLQIAADKEIKTLAELLDKTNKRLDEERKKLMDLQKRFLKIKGNKMTNKKHTELEIMEMKELKIRGRKTRSVTSIGIERTATVQYTLNTVKPVVKSEKTGSVCPDNCKRYEIENLKNKLEICEEQVKFLETRLHMIEDERAADFESIDEMIVNSKRVFAEALKKFQEAR